MERHTLAAQVRPGRTAAFRSTLGEVWPQIRRLLDRSQAANCSLWAAEDLVFAYCETPDGTHFPELSQILSYFSESLTFFPYPMHLMYEDIGIPRVSKELIRHRVFMTRLVPGAEEEYKRRHDALAATRKDINPGPDSNFTIWSSGGYIFGYDEIDITMEHDVTEAERASTISWETQMLEIMSWITNDIDWITHENHPAVMKLASYK